VNRSQLDLSLLPAELDTPAFREAWAEWHAYRVESRKPFTARAQRMALKRMAKWGAEAAATAIEYSIAQGFQGIYQEPQSQRTAADGATQRPRPMSAWEIKERLAAIKERLYETSVPRYIEDLDERRRAEAERQRERTELKAEQQRLKQLLTQRRD
jgi:hypothetical protein